ncbi:hypothetical protein HPP92_004663 [Vanilla planifolia]|uniref:Uncharacterized protein n=1 Tax=Vanilla planifolia TaxID=51239 RepID=A0A835RLE7_VANPL|nr:hypothetical protein HPP92_004663 [Vanilla planifolia]
MLNKSLKFLLMVLLMSLEYSYPKASINDSDLDVLQLTEVSVLAAGLLPVLCKCVENIECFDLSVASMDLLLKMVLPPDIWVHVLHESIHLEHLIQIMHQQNSRVSVAVAFNFFLTVAQTKGGAEMLCSNNLLSYLKIFLSNLVDEEPNPDEACFSNNGYKDDKHAHLLGLGFAIITAAIQSLHDDSSVFDIFDGTIRDFIAEAYTVFYFVSAPNLPSEGQSIKKKRIQGSPTSLTALRLVEHYLSLICLLEGQQSHQKRGLQEIDLDLRQKSIRLLSFISKEAQHAGEPSYNRTIPFICLPSLKEEAESNKTPSFICSNHGWFMVSALCLSSKARVSNVEKSEMPLVTRDKENASTHAQPTHLSDILAIQIYRIAALLLTHLCIQAKIVTDRAQEVGHIDLLCFPDLPMPDILHGLQDQTIAIVLDVCEASKSSTMSTEAESVCLLMLQILEKSFYLEFFVMQSCDIRPVLGRVDDISREIRSLIKEVKQHEHLEPMLASLRQIILLLYPGLIQTIGYM